MKISRMLAKLNSKLSSRPIQKIKLAAIAKNEAAYLPEWILHHIYFGFDQIEVHYNGTNDNTAELSHIFRDYPISLINADPIFDAIDNSPQIYIYKNILQSSFKQGFDAVLFLDVDEFWTPSDLATKVQDVVNSVEYFDTLSFQWKNKYEQFEEFGPAIEQQLLVDHVEQVKTLFKSYLVPKKMNAHNALDKQLVYRFEDGSKGSFLNVQNSRVKICKTPQNAFILHRKERSEREYLASLLRGRPIGKGKPGVQLKNNRSGFKPTHCYSSLKLPLDNFSEYRKFMESSTTTELQEHQVEARRAVECRYLQFIELMKSSYKSDIALFSKLLQGVSDKDVADFVSDMRAKQTVNR